ncbi:MAG: hypothetical protein E7402_05860 [Ruminococcaceae bacterium]|nr:hypothetical protein [Oscillospiraceae bacterium]
MKKMNNRKTKYSLNSKVFIVGAVLIVLLLNAILISLNDKISLELDFTKDKIFALTTESKEIVDKINEPVDIIILTAGEESETISMVKNVLDKYTQRSKQINVREVDVVKNPTEIQAYMEDIVQLGVGSLLMKQGDQHAFVDANDYFSQDGYSYIERSVTTKLASFLDDAEESTIYFTTGHGEQLSKNYTKVLEMVGYTIELLDTMTVDFPEEEDAIVIISAPDVDFSLDEINKMDAFLDRGGNVQIYFDPFYGSGNLENLQAYLSDDWGIARNSNVVIDTGRMIENSSYMFGNLNEHEITNPIMNINKGVGYGPANSLEILVERPASVTVSPLLSTSSSSYAKDDVSLFTSKESIKKAAGDQTGPFDVLLLANRQVNAEDNSLKIGSLLVSGSVLVFDSLTTDTRFANEDLMLNTIKWMEGNQNSITIRAKELPGGQMVFSKTQFWTWFVVLVVVIPLITLLLGIITYVKRRYR